MLKEAMWYEIISTNEKQNKCVDMIASKKKLQSRLRQPRSDETSGWKKKWLKINFLSVLGATAFCHNMLHILTSNNEQNEPRF